MHRNYVECIHMKTRRQAAILGFIEAEPVTSQRMLQRRLKADGFQVTQATISRDIKELGLVKQAADGAYRPAGQEAANLETAHAALYRALADFVTRIDRVQQLIVLGTGPGQAQPVALAIDRAKLPGVVGTIAGDDTVLMIARNARQAAMLVGRFGELMQE